MYVASLYFRVARGLMLSYVDDFALTAASLSYRANIRRLQRLFRTIEARAVRPGISFCVPKTQLIHWRTPSQRHLRMCLSLIQLDRELFHPRDSLQWLGYWFTPTLSSSTHFSRRMALAHRAFALIRHLSPCWPGLAPYHCQRLATSLVAHILLYEADLFTPNTCSISRLNTFWHKVQRWATTSFSSTPIGILAIESCLPPIPLLLSQRQRLAALGTVCALPDVNSATARVYPSLASLSSHRAPGRSRAWTKGLSSVYCPLSWETPSVSPTLQNHLPVDAVAHWTITVTGSLSRLPMINSHLVHEIATLLPAQSLMLSIYSALKKRIREALIEDWSRLFPPPAYYHHRPALHPGPLMGRSKFMAGRIYEMRAEKSYLAAHPSWSTREVDTFCPRCGLEPATLEHDILTCPCRQGVRARPLHGVRDVGHEAPVWSSLPLLKRLATYLSVTSTGFPPTMFPPTTPSSSRPSLFLPLSHRPLCFEYFPGPRFNKAAICGFLFCNLSRLSFRISCITFLSLLW